MPDVLGELNSSGVSPLSLPTPLSSSPGRGDWPHVLPAPGWGARAVRSKGPHLCLPADPHGIESKRRRKKPVFLDQFLPSHGTGGSQFCASVPSPRPGWAKGELQSWLLVIPPKLPQRPVTPHLASNIEWEEQPFWTQSGGSDPRWTVCLLCDLRQVAPPLTASEACLESLTTHLSHWPFTL